MWGFASYAESLVSLVLSNFPDYSVLIPEYPYHNGFDDADVELSSIGSISDYLAPLLKREGFEDFYAIGFSFGGLVIGDLAKRYNFDGDRGIRVKKMVVWASPVLGEEGITDLFRLLSDIYLRVPSERLSVLHEGEAARAILAKRRIRPFQPDFVKKYIGIIKSHRFGGFPDGIPQLYIYDPLDILVSGKNAIYVRGAARGRKEAPVRLVQIGGGGHLGSRAGWKKAIGAIKSFLDN